MNNNSRILKDKIILHVVFYVLFVVTAFVAVFIIDGYIHKRVRFLNSIYFNENSKIQLNDILKNKISSIENSILNYVNASDFNSMEKYEKTINELQTSLSNILFILENGGIYRETISVNVDGKTEVEHIVAYDKMFKEKYNLQEMDLRAKLVELNSLIDEFRNIVIDKTIAWDMNDLIHLRKVKEREILAVKSLEAFFIRLDESSNRLYFEAENAENFIKNYLDHSVVRFKSTKLKLNLTIGSITIIWGGLLFLSIFRIVKLRQKYQDDIEELNSSLESTVRKRTVELESEITIRKEKEQESIRKAQFMLDIIESLAHPFYVIDAVTYEIKLANEAAYSVIGGTGHTCYELTHKINHPCDGIDHPCPLRRVLETGQPTSVEHIHINRAGEKRFVEVHGYPIKDEKGNVVQMIEYSLDITDKKEGEAALINLNSMLEKKVTERTKKLEEEISHRIEAENRIKEREIYFRHLFANISDIIVIVDKAYHIRYASPSLERLFGYKNELIMGKPLVDLVHPRDAKMFESWSGKVVQRDAELKAVEFRMMKSSGQEISGEAIAKNMLNDNVIEGIVINIRDVSLRKRAESEIKKLALVMEQNPNSIVITDVDGKIEYVNPAFEQITGYSMDEVIGENPRVLKTDETPQEVFTDLWNTVTKGKVWNGEFVNKTKSGEHYIEHAIIAPIMDDRGEIISYLGMKENITELKQARMKAEESNKAKSMFLANMSHEIRTPLNGLMGFLELLQRTKLDSEQAEYVHTVKHSADSLLLILNDILDLSKIESGMMQIEKSEIDLGSCVLSAAKGFYARAYMAGIKLYSFIDPNLPQTLIGDSLRMQQILSNLLNNALKFTQEGGVVKVNLDMVEETDSKAKVVISVEDTGVGIPDDKKEAIFESFTQADSSITRKYGGTGLGLTICRNLLKMMNSKIQLESEFGKGSKFFFELSLDKPFKNQAVRKSAKNIPVFVCGSSDLGLSAVIQKYLNTIEADYKFIESLSSVPRDEKTVVIYTERNYQHDIASELTKSGAKIVFILDSLDNIKNFDIDDTTSILVRPFGGNEFYEAVTGISVEEDKAVVSETGTKLFIDGKVLIVEDNPINTKLIKMMLTRFGVDVDTAENGEIALEKIMSYDFDLVLMDVNMPVMDGITATGKVRDYEKNFDKKRVPIVALTAHAASDIDDVMMDRLFDGHVTKPVQSKELQDILKSYLKFSESNGGCGMIDLKEISNEIGLKVDVLRDLILKFRDSFNDDLKIIKEFLQTRQYSKIKSLINSNRSAAENLRLIPIVEICKGIEKSASIKSNNGIMTEIDKLELELDNLYSMIDTGN